MSLVVQKFGGTSVADSEKILSAARKAIRAKRQGHQVVMVVSAMGKNTDMLVSLAREVSEDPPAREMDMLLSTGEQVSVALMAMAISSLGYKAVSLTGAQIGIKTDSSHTKARIKSISTDRMRRLLDDGNIVIAAGFQGIDDELDITTLGRGGSDTTAVALAAVLGASQCEIYTDVDGVYTTDPRVLPEATLAKFVSYDEMLELASLGAGVMHSRSIEFGKKFGVPIHVRSSLSDIPGSLIIEDAGTEGVPVAGCALTRDEARITLHGIPDVPGTLYEIFEPVARQNVTVDMIVQNISAEGRTDMSFTVPRDDFEATLGAISIVADELGATEVTKEEGVSKVSVVGRGMATQSGIAFRMFRALADSGINMQMITTSEIKISALVEREQSLNALRTVHEEFELEQINDRIADKIEVNRETVDVVDVVSRLQEIGMEALVIDDVVLDNTQSRVTLRGVPNQPGIAADLFREIAEGGIFVDMIVQSFAGSDFADITFTVPRDQFEACASLADKISNRFGCEGIDRKESIAKLSVSGTGLRSHTGVAIGMFKALTVAGINIELVNTSEVSVNVVVDGDDGEKGIDCLREQFAGSLR
ncbi:MAG: aspartate kinase [Planctomycetota bacterium]